MNKQQCILLYSKYSSNSTKILNDIENLPIDLLSIFDFCPICIDNENIRQNILNSNNIIVNVVPCILLLFPDGGVEKYDGGMAFKWLQEIVLSYAPQAQPISTFQEKKVRFSDEVIQENQSEKVSKKNIELKRKSKTTSISDLDSEELTEDEENNYKNYQKKKQFKKNKKRNIKKSYKENIDSNEEFDEELEEELELRKEFDKINEKITETGKKKNNLMAAAMEMQKSREKEDNKNNRPGMPTGIR